MYQSNSKADYLNKDVYNQLAQVLNELPNGFPRTTFGVEVLILKKIFSQKISSNS